MKIRKNWSKKELLLAFNLYCKIPFGQYHSRNVKVIELANLIERSPNAVALKLCNFARLDPYHKNRGVKGLKHGSKLEIEIWNNFNNNWEELSYESEMILAKLESKNTVETSKPISDFPPGLDKASSVKVRLTQNFFREMILASYRSRCAICLLPERSLLIASHIIPWSVEVRHRMNPRNGICLCSLHDKAFDFGLIGIDTGYRIVLSKKIRILNNELSIQRGFLPYDNVKIQVPDKFPPEKKFLEYHVNNIFMD